MIRFLPLLLTFSLLLGVNILFAQTEESLVLESEDKLQTNVSDTIQGHSPRKATIYSAILPGAGQFYNKKYWKIPVVYTVLGGLGYFIYHNHTNYTFNRDSYLEEAAKETPNTLLLNTYELNTEYYRRNRDLTVVFTALAWALNVIDAHVDAHFVNYDISPDLSLNLEPGFIPISFNQQAPALSLRFNF